MKDRVALMLAALWWGSLTTIGFLVVPMLFARLGNPSVAGNFAAFFRCYDEAPNMGQFILDYLVPKVRVYLQ